MATAIEGGRRKSDTGTMTSPRSTAPAVIRTLIVDDAVRIRAAVRDELQQHEDIAVVGEAADGEAAVRATDELRPDIVVMDVSMPKMNGLAATACIRERLPQTRIVAFSSYSEAGMVRALLDAGATGYVLKPEGLEELPAAIRAAAAGGSYIGTDLQYG